MNTVEELLNLKKEKDAAVLAHYYCDEKVQEIADYVGDSFYLAKLAQTLPNKVLVMAGVYFMGESLKILNPDKTILMADIDSDCPMAHMVTKEVINEVRQKYDDLAVVSYINSTAEIKAHSDVCITSKNALNTIKNIKENNIFIIPDKNLSNYIKSQIKEKNIFTHTGSCPIHNNLKLSELESLIDKHPNAKVLCHPECSEDILKLSSFIGSTSDILKYVKESDFKEFIIVTEIGISYELKKNNKDKKLYFIDSLVCPDMKFPTVEKIIDVLKNNKNEVILDKELIEKASLPLKRMLEMNKSV